jgi:putative transposase
MTYNPDIHHRQSIRLKGYDYSSPGMYFITVCIQNRDRHLFGEIDHGKMILNHFGEIIREQWHIIPNRFNGVTVDEFVVMPNHIHGILHFVGAPLAGALVGVHAGAHGDDHDNRATDTRAIDTIDTRATARVAPTKTTAITKPMTGDVVGAFKSLCVHGCLQWIKLNDPQFGLGPLWQRNYWEHIIRNEPELDRIREYIRNNPLKREKDSLCGYKGDHAEEDWMI